LILQDGQHRGTFLPKVWESLATPEKFLDGLMVKAKLPKNHWSDTVKVLRYTTERFSEHFKTAIA
ncbi:MAG: AMMECR1 domain-containing protein, partial [Amylibacter sp.]